MKDKLSSYFGVGTIGDYSIMVDRKTYQHYYITKTNPDGVKPNYKAPAGLILLATTVIRQLDTKGYQANFLVLLFYYLLGYLAAVAFLRRFKSLEIEIEVYHFKSPEQFEAFVKSSVAHANTILYFVVGFGLATGITGILYFITHSFLFLFMSLSFSCCMFLLLQLEPIKRRLFLAKLEKENYHR